MGEGTRTLAADTVAGRAAPRSALIEGARDKVPVLEKVAWAAGSSADAIMTTSIGQLALRLAAQLRR